MAPPAPWSGSQQLVGYRLVPWSEGLAVAEPVIGPQQGHRDAALRGGARTFFISTICGQGHRSDTPLREFFGDGVGGESAVGRRKRFNHKFSPGERYDG